MINMKYEKLELLLGAMTMPEQEELFKKFKESLQIITDEEIKNIKMVKCKKCGKYKIHRGDGYCSKCFNELVKIGLETMKCKKCGRYTRCYHENLCTTCYFLKYGSKEEIYKYKAGSYYFGVFINEQLLYKIFKDVKQMRCGNPGYDFVCNKDKKIDAKSSTTRISKKGIKKWSFDIGKNTIADYFFCVAYDNRKDLNPLHMWLISGEDVNDKSSLTIQESTLHEWSQYEQPIDKALLCCDTIKNYNREN